jgi:peptidoglycan/LPS O-acetylase OafA/YrhL
MNKLNNNFDILRLIFSLSVFFAHWNTLTEQNLTALIFNLSGLAVDMFFVVSGFLIFWSFNNDQNKVAFFIKRFFRVFPLYAMLIILQSMFYFWVAGAGWSEVGKYFLSNIMFLNFLMPSVGDTLLNLKVNAINGSLWTLKNEVFFYVLVPMIYGLYKKWGFKGILVVYIFSAMYLFAVSYNGGGQLSVLFPAQLRLFLSGILLYILLDKREVNYSVFLTVLTVSILVSLLNDIFFISFFYPFLLSAILWLLAFKIKKIKINFDFSYSFYILHFPVIQLSLYFNVHPSNPLLGFVLLFTIILVLSFYSEKYIEKKLVTVGKRFAKTYR